MLKVDNLCKSFNGKKIYTNFGFEVEKGEMIVLSGPSGCGKTTLLNIIGMLDTSFTGEVTIMGHVNPKMNSKGGRILLQNDIGYIFQNFALIENLSVEDNLLFAIDHLKISKNKKLDRINRVLDVVMLRGYSKKKVYSLSGGEQQRVAIARVILKDVKLILADEPTGSLDSKNRNLVLSILDKLNQRGKTIIMVSHDEYIVNKYKNINIKGVS